MNKTGRSSWYNIVEQQVKLFQESPSLPKLLDGERLSGIGGVKHQYIQLLIKQLARKHGYQATIEAPIQGCLRKVDVGIIGQDVSIACEIPISSKYSEIENLRKCLDAGYNYVISIAVEKETLNIVRKQAINIFTPEELNKIKFFFPEEFENFLQTLQMSIQANHSEQIILGYRVRVNYLPISDEELKARRSEITQVIARSILREQGYLQVQD